MFGQTAARHFGRNLEVALGDARRSGSEGGVRRYIGNRGKGCPDAVGGGRVRLAGGGAGASV